MFRVNPDRIPAGGVRARCARCRDTFLVTRPAQAGAPPSPPRTTRPGSPPDANHTATPPAAPSAAPSGPPLTAEQATEPAPPPGAAEDASRSVPSTGPAAFTARDPNEKAERLARALVSDIVAYHPERRARCYESGNLRTEFRDEIMKSWEEYVAQVGLELAKSTPYFRDALNTILARGQKVF